MRPPIRRSRLLPLLLVPALALTPLATQSVAPGERLLAPAGAETEDPATGVPDRVVLNPTEDTTTSVMVTWRTAAGLEDHRAQVRLPGGGRLVGEFPSSHEESAMSQPEAEHHSTLMDGLEPGTAYEYRVGGEAGWSRPCTRATRSTRPTTTPSGAIGSAGPSGC